MNSEKLTECISYFKRAEWVQAALLGDSLVVVEEVGYVLWRQGDPAVVEQWYWWWFVVGVLSLLSDDHSERKNNAQRYQEQHSQNHTDM